MEGEISEVGRDNMVEREAIGIMSKKQGIEKMKAALESVQHYLLVLPEGAHKEILYQIADALKDPSKMPAALYDAKYYLLKYAGDHIQNIADAGK